MRSLRIGTLQWAVGAFSAVMGTMMLVAPHQYRLPEYSSLRLFLPWIGCLFVGSGAALLVVVTLRCHSRIARAAHLLASAGLLLLAAGFADSGIWTGTVSYLSLGLATAIAPYLAASRGPQPYSSRGDLFAVAIALACAVNGFLFLFFPGLFSVPLYETPRPYLSWYGGAFLVSGVALLLVQFLKSVRPLAVWVACLSVGASFYAFGLPDVRYITWTGAGYYGGFGAVVAFLPRLTSRWSRVDLDSFRARLAITLAVAIAIPLVLIVSVETGYEERLATQEALAQQQVQATTLSRQFVEHLVRHQSVAVALASQQDLLMISPESRRVLLRSLESTLPEPVEMAVFDVAGNEIADGGDASLGLANLAGSPIFSDLRDGLNTSMELMDSANAQGLLLAFGVRILDQSGRFSGVVVIRSDVSRLSAIVSRASPEVEANRYLVDGRGRLLARHGVPWATLEDYSKLAPVAALMSGAGAPGSIAYTGKEGDLLAGYARVPGLDWGVVVEQPMALALSSTQAGRDLASRILLIAICLTIIVGAVAAGLFANPLSAFAMAAERLGAGDVKAPLPHSNISEISRLATVFSEMRERLAARTAESERAAKALRARERQQAAVAQIGQWALAGTELQTLLNGAVALVALTLDVPFAKLLELMPHGKSMKLRAVVGHEDEMGEGAEVPTGKTSQAGFTLLENEPVIAGDLSTETRFSMTSTGTRYGFVSGMSVLVSGRDRPFGVLIVNTTSPRSFTQDDVHFLQSVANHLAMAIERIRVEEAQSFLAEASGLLASSLDYETTMGSVARLAVPRLADWCTVDIVSEDRALNHVAVAHVDPAKEKLLGKLRADHRIDAWQRHPGMEVVRTGLPQLFEDVPDELVETMRGDDVTPEIIRQLGMKSAALLPLRARDRTIGVLTLVSARTSHRYGPSELALAEGLAHRCAVAVDNTRLYHEAREAVRARDEFLSVAAHELKTPVTSLRGYAQLSLRQIDREGELDPVRTRRAFQVIDTQAGKLTRLVTQLLDVSRMEAGRLALERQIVDLSALVEGVVATEQMTTTKHTIQFTAPLAVPAMADPLRLEQVVINLVDNAIKYSPDGGIIEIRLFGAAVGSVRLEVRDHGLGVPPEHRQRIFDRFYQAHAGKYMGGMGLGLYISQRIVQLHGGRIAAEFPPDGGTRFVLNLPALPDGNGTVAQ